jgi:phage recombination protein Bet
MNELQQQQTSYSEETIQILVDAGIIPQGTPSAQIAVYLEVARRHDLDPFTKQLHLVAYPKFDRDTKTWGSTYVTIIGIDGYRKRACSSGTHAGTDDCLYDLQSDGRYLSAAQLKKASRLPLTATKTVKKIVKGLLVSFTKTVVFSEYDSGKSKWASAPFTMIDKVAESHALRMAFPEQTEGLMIEEEVTSYLDETALPLTESKAPKGLRTPMGNPAKASSNPSKVYEEVTKQEDDDDLFLGDWKIAIIAIMEKEDVAAVTRLQSLNYLYRKNEKEIDYDEDIIELFKQAKNELGQLDPSDVKTVELWK